MEPTAASMEDRHVQILGRLAELGLELAEDLQRSALEAEDPQAKARLAEAFHRISRSTRQSLALEARLKRDAARAQREATAEATAPRQRRRAEVRARLARLVWTEAEDEHTARYWRDGIERLLDAAEFEPDFDTRALDQLVEDLAATLQANAAPEPAGKQKPSDRFVVIERRLVHTDGTVTIQRPPADTS